MTDSLSQQAAAIAGQDGNAPSPGHVTFDGRHPKLLDHRGHALEVTAGHVDVFAVGLVEGNVAGARHHLFRVERGEIILDLQDGFSGPACRSRFWRSEAPAPKRGLCHASTWRRSIRSPTGSGSSGD
jgi:hypothetical protein